MFTGLVEACVPVLACEPWGPGGTGRRLVLAAPAPPWSVTPGESIAVAGCCLSAVGPPGPAGELTFELSAETLARTWFGELAPGRRVNLERSLQLGERLGGHLVAGHVDAVGTILDLHDAGDGGRVLTLEVPSGFERYLIDKGSIAVDGISLTVVQPHGRRFDVALIPLTLSETQLGEAEPGQRVNLEADMIGKWIERLLRTGEE